MGEDCLRGVFLWLRPEVHIWGFFMASRPATEFMRLAFGLAEKGRGKTSPNPIVGAVIVRGGEIVGKGYHRAIGQEHAEIAAIRMAGSRARGSTLYINLEPCAHTGRTGPCSEAIIAAGIKKVVLSIKDPNPLVNGKGIRRLRKFGIKVESGLLKDEARRLNDIYLGFHENKRPYVILKLAQSLDGKIATIEGDSKWISSLRSRRFAHQLRSAVDAVVVGAGTVREDDPALTVRHVKGRSPYRIILSGSLDIPSRSRLLRNNEDMKTIIATSERSLRSLKGRSLAGEPILWSVKNAGRKRLDLPDFVSKAGDFGLQSLLIEGGAALATSFLRVGLVDKLVAITAPVIVGSGKESFGNLGINMVSEAVGFDSWYTIPSGPDTIFIGYPRKVK